MLVDDVKISIKAGNGGNGSAHLLRTGQTEKGGPDGGDGGNGGNIYFQGTDDITALKQFRFTKKVVAENGIGGGRQKLYGRAGEDTIVKVPLGTIIKDLETNQLYEILDTEKKLLLAKGGIGGRGNVHFATATYQTPRTAEAGTPGESRTLRIKLRLIADLGLIGLPNAGKSSLLESLTNATPKIANYPFTTLEPNLGMMGHITIADIPGLIEGASEGKGLGIKFLQHVEKTKLLVHCVSVENDDVVAIYATVRDELKKYNPKLLQKAEIVLLTKTDLIAEKEAEKKLKQIKTIAQNVMAVTILDEDILKKLAKHLQKEIKN